MSSVGIDGERATQRDTFIQETLRQTQTYHLSPALLGVTVSSASICTVLAAIIDRFLVLFYYPGDEQHFPGKYAAQFRH